MADIIPPPLREELKIAKLVQMGELSYVIKEPDKQSFYHFEPAQYELMSLFNGSRTLIQIIELFNLRSSEYEYDLEDAEELYDSCREFQLLTRTRAEQNTALLEKISEERKKKLLQSQGSALFLRFQLVDPNNFFNKIIPKLRFIWDPRVIKLQIAFVFCAFLAVLFQGERFFDDFNRVYLQAHQHDFGLLSIWLIALFAIAIHECGHGLTCKYFGGDVHEMGFLLLAFQPCLYCNVNDAWLFEEKRHKIYVAIAGVWVEILLAAISGFVWLIVDVANPIGYVAFVLLTIGTATSLLVNLNPLLKFDGYYILTDLLEIRNLRQNSIAWFSYKLKTRLFRMDEEAPLTPTTRERRVYMIYGCSVVVYMFFMLSFIAILGYNLVSAQFGFIANLAFIWLVFLLVKKLTGDWGKTLKNWSREVFWGSTLRRKLSLVAVVLTVILMIFWQPRIRVHSTGAVDAPTHIVYAPESGFISQLAFDNQRELTGQKNQPLLTLNSYELELTGIELRSAENMLIMQQQESLSADDAIESQRLRIEQSLLNEKLLSLNKQYTSLEIQKPVGDWLVDSMPKQSLLGRYFGSGQPILTLVAKKKRFIDVVVDQRDVYLITQGDRGLIRFSGVGPAIYDAHLESISPVAKLDGIEQSLIVRMSIMTDNNLQTPPLGLSGDVMILGQPTPLFMHFVHTIRKILRADLWL